MSNSGENHLRKLLGDIDTRAHPVEGLQSTHSPLEFLAVDCLVGDEVIKHELDFHIVQPSGDTYPRAIFPRLVTSAIREDGPEERERFILESNGRVTYMGPDRISSSFGTDRLDDMIGCAEMMLGQMVEPTDDTMWTLGIKSGKWKK